MALINGDERPVALFPGAVTADACGMLLDEAAALELRPGQVEPTGAPVDRAVAMQFLPRDHWSKDILWTAATQANHDMGWHYALTGLESLQFSVYRPGDRHDWHLDTLSHGDLIRKLTVVVQLDDGTAYTGGDLELMGFGSPSPTVAPLPAAARHQGTTVVFPSYLLHRVAPVTEGQRRTLVAWVLGPRFT